MLGAGEPGTGGLEHAAWVVDVDTAGTDNPSDDTIAVSDSNQSLPGTGGQTPEADVTQAAVRNAVFKAGCRRNPSPGVAAVQRAGTRGGGWVLFRFHAACDVP